MTYRKNGRGKKREQRRSKRLTEVGRSRILTSASEMKASSLDSFGDEFSLPSSKHARLMIPILRDIRCSSLGVCFTLNLRVV